MNILIVALDFKPNFGGIAEYTHQIAQHLQRRGDEVVVLSTIMENAHEHDVSVEYKVVRFRYHQSEKLNIKNLYLSYKVIKEVAQKHSTDVIIANSFGSFTHLCWLVAKLHGVPYAIFVHGRDVTKDLGLYAWLERILVLRGARKVFCNSSFTQQAVMNLKVPAKKIRIFPPGVSKRFLKMRNDMSRNDLRRKFDLSRKNVVLTLGRLEERKGLDKTIEALSYVVQKISNVVYFIVGDGPYRNNLEDLVTRFKLQDVVFFIGYVPDEDKAAYYSVADLFVMPNRELPDGDVEGFGIVYLEANAYGKPVIAGKSGGVLDAVIDGETGILVNSNNVIEIADAIIQLLENKRYGERLGMQGKKRVEQEFVWDMIVPALQREIHKLHETSS
jgi:phosphatidylinositol alpha-1,6-mannosyltransferase